MWRLLFLCLFTGLKFKGQGLCAIYSQGFRVEDLEGSWGLGCRAEGHEFRA